MKGDRLGAGVIVLSVALTMMPAARGADGSLDLADVAVLGHVGAPGVRFRQPPLVLVRSPSFNYHGSKFMRLLAGPIEG